MEDIYFQNSFSNISNFCIVIVFLAALVWRLKKENLSQAKGGTLLLLRLAAFVMLLVALQNPMKWDSEVLHKRKQMLLLVDDSYSMKVKNGEQTRWQAVQQAVKTIGESKLNKKFLLPMVRLSHPWDTVTEDYGLDNLALVEGLKPEANESLLETVTWNQLKRFDRRNLSGVILLSDGRSTDAVQEWGHIGKSQVPIHTILPHGKENFDSRIASIVGNEFCRKGDTIRLVAQIQHQGPPRTSEVALYEDDRLIEHRKVTLDSKTLDLSFQLPMEKVGWHRMKIKLLENDPVVENNERSLMVHVVDDKLKVLLVGGAPHYDFRYLREALDRDKSVELSVYLQGADKAHPGWGKSLNRFPKELKDFLKYDVVILQDIDSKRVEEYSWIALRRFVEEAQGALLVQAGYQFDFPVSAITTPLGKLLPHTPGEAHVKDSAFKFKSTDTLFDSVLPKNGHDWPQFYWAAHVSEVPPLTKVIWEHPSALTDDAKPLPLVSWCRQGRGKVGYVGLANLWRFRGKAGEICHYGLYSTLIRFLADNRYSGQNKLVRFRVGTEGSVSTGQPEIIRLEVHDPTFNPYEAKEVNCTLTTPSKSDIKLTVPSLGDGIYQMRHVFEEEGLHSLSFDLEGSIKEYKFIVHMSNKEFEDISLGAEAMEQLATRSRGHSLILKDNQLENFITELNKLPDEVPRQRSKILWNTSWFGGLVFLLLSIEWLLRRIWSLP